MLNSGATKFNFLSGDFVISWDEGSAFKSFSGVSGIDIRGDGAVIRDNRVYANTAALSPVFNFSACSNVAVSGVGYEGAEIPPEIEPVNYIGQLGATFINLKNACSNVVVNAAINNCRYGVRSGDYTLNSEGYNIGINTTLSTYRCGYPIAHYLAENVTAEIDAEQSRRAAYLGGVHGFTVNARSKNQVGAPVAVLLTDAKTGTGTSRGCANGSAYSTDTGSTSWPANGYAIGLSLSRVDPGTVYENIRMHFDVTGSDSVASTLGGALINSSATAFAPEYPADWSTEITLRNITISGTLDRSAQTVAAHAFGEIYVWTDDGPGTEAQVSGLVLDGVQTIAGAARPLRPLYMKVVGMTNDCRLVGCDFGEYPTDFTSNEETQFVNS